MPQHDFSLAGGHAGSFFSPAPSRCSASRDRHKLGSEILHNLIDTEFTGKVIPVHPVASELQGLPAYRSLDLYPDSVDLAVVAVPAAHVEAVIDQCLAKGVKAICIISAGFGECSDEGRQREQAIVEKARRAGCRVIGPNCMGLLNTHPDVRLNATFSPVYPPEGKVAMSTQSGALGLAILDHARSLNLGISSFASIGNKADVSGNDLLEYWAEDPRTDVILLYRTFGNREVRGIALRVSRTKPIVALKSGDRPPAPRRILAHRRDRRV